MCSTCDDGLNTLWTKILPVVNAATCAQVHVQIIFCSTCSMMVQRCGVPLPCSRSQLRLPCSLAANAGHDRRMLHDSVYTRAHTRFAWSPFFFEAPSAALRRGRRSPVSSFLLPLQAGRRSCQPMLKSVSSIRRRHAGHDGEVFLWPSGPHRETK